MNIPGKNTRKSKTNLILNNGIHLFRHYVTDLISQIIIWKISYGRRYLWEYERSNLRVRGR